MTITSKNAKDLTHSTVENTVEQKEFCTGCYTELYYYTAS